MLGWSETPVEIPSHLIDGLQSEFINLGVGKTRMPFQVATLIESIEQWKGLVPEDRESKLNDPLEFKEFLFGRKYTSQLLVNNQNRGAIQRDILLHIVFPDSFETISSSFKQQIASADAFARYITEPTDDVDRKIGQIRQGIKNRLGRNFYFYDSDIIRLWRDGETWDDDDANNNGQDECERVITDLQALSDALTLPLDFLEEIETLLKDKRQVIFQGPPGTGKTYVAREIAEHLAGSSDRVTLVQFHPSYSYEDFVQGYRPNLSDGGQAGFVLRDGPLLRAARAASQDKANKHFLIIDEINRGNLASVFGELYFLLEYRDEEISLQYSTEREEGFSLPENLYIIGTMNTADRSIALVDLALRRRFHFVEFHPDEFGVEGLLRRWLEKNAPDMEWVADVVDKANEELNDRHAAIGPSYFMKDGLNEDAVKRVWRHSVMPYIEERLFGDGDRLDQFDIETLRSKIGQGDELPSEGDAVDASDAENDGGGE